MNSASRVCYRVAPSAIIQERQYFAPWFFIFSSCLRRNWRKMSVESVEFIIPLSFFLTFAINSLTSYISYITVILITLLKEKAYRIVMTIFLSLNTIFLMSILLGFCRPIRLEYFNFIGFTTMLLISSLIRIRCFLKKWRTFVIVLMIVDVATLGWIFLKFYLTWACSDRLKSLNLK